MKTWIVLLAALTLSTACPADEIKIRGAQWDDVSLALNITPLYLEIESATTARKLTLVLEVFQEGKLVKTYRSTSTTLLGEAKPINLKSSLFFKSKDQPAEYSLTWTVDTGDGLGMVHYPVPKSLLNFEDGFTHKAVPSLIATSAKSLIGFIGCGLKGRPWSPGKTLDETIAANKSATVIGIFLEHE